MLPLQDAPGQRPAQGSRMRVHADRPNDILRIKLEFRGYLDACPHCTDADVHAPYRVDRDRNGITCRYACNEHRWSRGFKASGVPVSDCVHVHEGADVDLLVPARTVPDLVVISCRRCGQVLHPAAAAGGFDTHPSCDLEPETEKPLATVHQIPIDLEGRNP